MTFSYEKAKRELLEEKERLEHQLNHVEAIEHENIGYSNHMAEDATEAFTQSVDESLRRNLQNTLEEVNRALRKFEEGTYGLCEECGARIERARLEALPQARHCLDCQGRQENVARAG